MRRLTVLLVLAALAALPEALVRADDAQVAFQTWLVVQLLGVIVAAIAIAAMFSVLGLGIVRLCTRPLRHRASTFVAWSFLRAPRIVLPLPLRAWRHLRLAVDADPATSGPRPLWLVPLGLALAAGGAWLLQRYLWLDDLGGYLRVMARNTGAVLALHGYLLALSGLPWRRVRSAGVALALIAGVVAAVANARHPAVLQWFEPFVALGAVGIVVAVSAWRAAGPETGLPMRLQRQGQLLLPAGLVLGGVAGALFWAQQGTAASWLAIFAAVVAMVGLYLVLQGQAKVSLPVFVSIVGVAAGTWALTVVLSVMGGFAADLRAKMLVANAHALVERPGRAEPLHDVARLSEGLRGVAGIAGVSPQVRGDAILSSAFNVNNFVAIRGVDVRLPEVRRDLGATLATGSLHLLEDPAALGSDRSLARRPALEPSDLPPVPEAPPPSQPAVRESLDDLLRLAPGPGEPPPPQAATARPPPASPRHDVILVPSEEAAPAPPALSPEDLGTQQIPAGPEPRLPPSPLPPDLGRMLGDDLGAHNTEPVDVPVAPGILLGAELARSLQAELGDRIEVVTPDADVGPTGLRPRVRTFRVAGTFETGLYEADSKVAYVDLAEAARYFNLDGQANVLELRLDSPELPDAVVALARARLRELGAPGDVEVLDWRALNRSLFSALAFERLVIFLVLGLIILVAAFSIVSALTMVIIQKHDSIAMLRAMGSSAGAIRSSFVQMGGVIGLIGTMAGGVLGVATCLLILHLGIQLPEAYYVRTLPVSLQAAEIAAVALASVCVSLVATVFPATSAARLSPLEGLRHG